MLKGSGLTPKEFEILTRVAAGLESIEIAAVLHISETTVKNHLGHIYIKLEARNRAHAIAIAFRKGIIT